MKYTILLFGLAILMASVAVAAAAKLDRKCYREMRAESFSIADSTHHCDLSLKVKPHQIGWHCDAATPPFFYKAKGGFKRKQDAWCVVE